MSLIEFVGETKAVSEEPLKEEKKAKKKASGKKATATAPVR